MKLPKNNDTGAEIRGRLVCPRTALELLEEHYAGARVPKDFIQMAIEDIDDVARLSKGFKVKHDRQYLKPGEIKKLVKIAKTDPEKFAEMVSKEVD